jgi:RNA polymerase sigma-70 factor, ECF subfamily
VSGELVRPFLGALDDGARAGYAGVSDLEPRLARMLQEARETWPELIVAPDAFVTWVAQRLPAERSPVDGLAAVRSSDLYLACACAGGDQEALAIFDRRYLGEIDAALARMRLSRAAVEEVKQLVRQKLFVAREGIGKIGDYSGRGDLRRWVRSIAIRTSLNQLRKGKREILVGDDRVLAGVSADDDPEIAYMKERYRTEFRDAFQRAIGVLSDRQQVLLRYSFIDGLNIDQIGAIYRVHRVTAYRWIEKARERLVAETLRLMKSELQVEKGEFDSIMRMIRSQLHLSLHRYLGRDDSEPSD